MHTVTAVAKTALADGMIAVSLLQGLALLAIVLGLALVVGLVVALHRADDRYSRLDDEPPDAGGLK